MLIDIDPCWSMAGRPTLIISLITSRLGENRLKGKEMYVSFFRNIQKKSMADDTIMESWVAHAAPATPRSSA